MRGFARGCLLRIIVGAVIALAVRLAFSFDTEAHHVHYPHNHIFTILHNDYWETFCVEVEDGSYPLEIADDVIYNTLNSPSHPHEDWHGTHWIQIVNNGQCGGSPGQPRLVFTIKPELSGGVPGRASYAGNYDDTASGHYNMGQLERTRTFIDLDADYLFQLDSAYSLINHEVGHAFGLCDGGPTYNGSSTCQALSYCGGVMHSYGCGAWLPWPNEFEHSSVESQVPGGAGGGGGFPSKVG